jgi:uncharacterized membrane protein
VTGRDVYPVGAIARFLDKVPSVVGTPIYILLWIVFLLGWLVLLAFGHFSDADENPSSEGSSEQPTTKLF